MKLVIQRVDNASVTIGDTCHSIGLGLVMLVGFGKSDTIETIKPLSSKVFDLRLFSNADGKFDYSLRDVDGELLIVSQFTLYGDCRKGRRPSFENACPPGPAKILYAQFVDYMTSLYPKIKTGEFGAHMSVTLTNNGPVTLVLDSDQMS